MWITLEANRVLLPYARNMASLILIAADINGFIVTNINTHFLVVLNVYFGVRGMFM